MANFFIVYTPSRCLICTYSKMYKINIISYHCLSHLLHVVYSKIVNNKHIVLVIITQISTIFFEALNKCSSLPQRTGLLSMLDVEGSVRGTPESYIQKVKVQHKGNGRLFEPKANHIRSFGIHHFASRVIYDASDFLGE